MSVSPQLLALMSFTPTRSNGVTSWSILMNFRYPFPWEIVSSFVLREKAKGPPDDMVTLEVDRNTFKYQVRLPWYARLVLGKSITWHDVLEADPRAKVLAEDGVNVSLRRLGTVRDVSSWRACKHDPGVTVFKKRLDFNIRMPLGPTIIAQVAQPLIRWFNSKSRLCRTNEVKAIREFLDKAETETEEEKKKRKEEDTTWLTAVRVETLSLVHDIEEQEDGDAQAEATSTKSSPKRARTEAGTKARAAKARAAAEMATERSPVE